MHSFGHCLAYFFFTLPVATQQPVDLGAVTEKHVMVPMRDGVKLSTYLYMPAGKGPWPVIYEQRYADLRAAATRQSFARIAKHGYVFAVQNFRGTHLSEGTWVGYRALGWASRRMVTIPWSGSQPSLGLRARWARSAARRPASLRTSWPSPRHSNSSAST